MSSLYVEIDCDIYAMSERMTEFENRQYEFGIPSPEMTSLFFNETLHLMTHLHYFSFEFPPLPFCPLNTGSDDSFEVDENSIIYIMIEKFE